MDYGFTKIEIMEIYIHYKRKIAEYEAIKNSGKIKANPKELALYNSIIEKILANHPTLDQLPL